MQKLIANKYIKDYDENKPSHLNYWDVNNLYGWAMLQKLPVNNFEWIKDTSQFNEDFIKNYNEESDKEYFQYLQKLHELHNDLLFVPERTRIKKVKNFEADLHDKNDCVINIRNLKQALNHGLVLRESESHRVIKFNQNAWLKPYIDMNTDSRKKTKNDFEKHLFKLMNNSVFANYRKYVKIKRY